MTKTILAILAVVASINILTSIYFITLMGLGIVFIIFIKMIETKSYYLLIMSIFTFLLIENIQGFNPFSLSILAFVLYVFINSNMKHLLSSKDILKSLYVVLFYVGVVGLYSFSYSFDISLLVILMVNMVLDIVFVGLFI